MAYNAKASYLIHNGDMLKVLPTLTGKFHAVLCDPPYGISFMGKAWDTPAGPAEFQSRVCAWGNVLMPFMLPGALVFMFGGTRMWHRLAAGMEDAGFEMWDTLMWLHGQGFPKGQDISKLIDSANGASWSSHKTPALKPAWEPVLCFRAPSQGKTYAELAQMFGSGALNIDAARIEGASGDGNPHCGRYPANLALDEESAVLLDAKSGISTSGKHPAERNEGTRNSFSAYSGQKEITQVRDNDTGGASRFFYCAKASTAERDGGALGNPHPTVKPIDLCEWLAKLLLPPTSVSNRRILVPFSGSGSEMIGCLGAGWDEVVGVELDAEYCNIARARIKHHIGLRPADGTPVVVQKTESAQPRLF